MQKAVVLSLLAASCCALAQVDWPVYRGNPQRTGAQLREQNLSKESLGKFQLLWKRKLGDQPLTAPSILGRLISHRGFLELVFIADRAGDVFAIDDDLNRVLWTRHLPSAETCGSGTTGPMFPPLPGNTVDSDEDNPYAPRPVYVVAGDGKLYALNPMTGGDMTPPLNFVPPGAALSNLNYWNKVVYTTTSSRCGGAPEAVWALDTVHREVASYHAPDGAAVEDTGVTIGADGTVYALLKNARFEAGQESGGALVALTPKDLRLKDYFVAPGSASSGALAVLPWDRRELIVTSFDNRIVVLDANRIGGSNHHVVLNESSLTRHTGTGNGRTTIASGFAVSNVSATSARIYAAALRTASTGSASESSIVSFNVDNSAGRPSLQLSWITPWPGIASAPVVANGIVYTLTTQGSQTMLHALDATNGRQLYESENIINSRIAAGGLSLANGHLCFGTQEGTLYCFGLPIDL
jgi:outer membrane protein assembly factor BamB